MDYRFFQSIEPDLQLQRDEAVEVGEVAQAECEAEKYEQQSAEQVGGVEDQRAFVH